jgi:hypothetical protein
LACADARSPQSASRGLSTEVSSTSLASISTNASSEDAFDIAEFPSLAQLDSSYNLFDLTDIPTGRKASMDRIAFPVPPAALPEMPPQRQSTPPPARMDPVEEARTRRFAELEERHQGSMGLGLGFFSDDPTPMPSPALMDSVGASSSRASSVSGASSLSSKSFDASTLDSSAANTSFSGATIHKETFEQAFPPELSATIPWFAQSPPSTFMQSLPQPINALTIDVGSAHPALASPFATASSSSPNRVAAPAGQADESLEAAQLETRTSPLAIEGLTDALDETGVANWVTGRSPASLLHEELVSQQIEDERQQQARQAASQPTGVSSGPAPLAFVRPDLPPEPKSLRRFSSLGLLKKRKSEAVLRDASSSQQQEPARPKMPGLFKRKSDAALNTLMRAAGGRSRAQDKENAPAADTGVRRPFISAPLSAQNVANLPPRRLEKRSASTPKLSKLFASSNPTAEKVPDLPTPSSTANHADPDQSMAQSTTSSKMKKRISMYFDKRSSAAPTPAVQKPKPSSPIRERAPAGISIDVDKANEGRPVSRVVSEHHSIASTLEIVSPPATAPPSALFSGTLPSTATSPPASVQYHGDSISSMSAVVHGALFEKAEPSALPPTPFSAPASQTNFVFPTLSLGPNKHSSAQDSKESTRFSIAGFLRADALDPSKAAPDEATPTSPLTVFPSTKSPRSTKLDGSSPLLSVFEAAEEPSLPASSSAVTDVNDLALAQILAPVPPPTVVAFPVLTTIPSMEGSGGGGDGDHSDSDSDEDDDDYGSRTGSSTEEQPDDEDDRPLGVVVPGALTAQKSLRLSAAKKSRAERKARKNEDKLAPATGRSRQREDPFELEGTAAMVNTPPRSKDGHERFSASGTSAQGDPRQRSPSAGHDSLLPQTDASIYRRTVAAGLTRSPSSPLEPVVAESALTIDSPEIQKRSLPSLPAPSSHTQPTRPVRKASKDSTLSPRSPTEGYFATTFRSPTTYAPSTMPSQSRPLIASRTSSLSIQGGASTAALHRQPSLHPDAHAQGVRRHASGSSSTHSTMSHSKGAATVQRTRSTASSSTGHMSEQRIYLDAAFGQFMTVPVSDKTMAGEVVALAKARGALAAAGPSEGGWALWESWRSMGYGKHNPFERFSVRGFAADLPRTDRTARPRVRIRQRCDPLLGCRVERALFPSHNHVADLVQSCTSRSHDPSRLGRTDQQMRWTVSGARKSDPGQDRLGAGRDQGRQVEQAVPPPR